MKLKTTLLILFTLVLPISLFPSYGAPGQSAEAPGAPRSSGAAQPSRTNADFLFPGGAPWEFLRAIEKHYSVDWLSVADIPEDMRDVHIPVLRMSPESAAALLGGGRGGRSGGGGGGGGGFQGGAISSGGYGNFGGGAVYVMAGTENGGDVVITNGPSGRRGPGVLPTIETRNPLEAVIGLYNSLAQTKPELGRLIVQGAFAKPSVVVFQSGSRPATPRTSPQVDVKLKAFPLKGIPTNEWHDLGDFASDQMRKFKLAREGQKGTGQQKLDVQLSLNIDTGLLVAIGTESMLDAVDSLVTAWRANQVTGDVKPAPTK